MIDKEEVFTYCLENPNLTSVDLVSHFGITGGQDQEEARQVMNDCLLFISLIKKLNSEKTLVPNNKADSDDIMKFLISEKTTIIKMIEWFKGNKEGDNDLELPEVPDGQSKRMTLHLIIDLMDRLKLVADRLGVSVSKLVNQLIFKFLEE